MHSKLSMKNLHTFSQDNPFVRDRSISSRSKHELQFGSSRKEEFKGVEDILRGNVRKSHHQYNYEVLRDSTNTPDTGFFKTQLHRQFSTLEKQPRTNPNPYPKHPSIPSNPSKSHPNSCSSILHLLSQQKQCIQKIRQTVERDKIKIHGNFQDFKQTICNIIDDLKLSVCASVDAQFQYFVNQFRIVKVQYANYSNVKKEFWGTREGEVEKAEREGKRGLGATVYPGMIRGDGKQINNEHLLLSVIEDIKDCKKHINYVQFSQIQQRLLGPLLQTTKHLVNQLNIESYYNPQIAHETFKTLQESIEQQVHKMYQKMDGFITDHIRQKIQLKQARNNIKGKQNIIRQQEQRKRNQQQIENNYNNERNRQISPIAKKNRNQHQHEYQHQQLNRNQSQSQHKQMQKHQQRAQVANKQYGSYKEVNIMKTHVASPLNQEEIYISKNTIQIQPIQPQELIHNPKQTGNGFNASYKNQKNVSTANTDFYQTNKNKFETQSDYVNENQSNPQQTHQNPQKQLKLSFSNPQKQKKQSSQSPLPIKYKLHQQSPIKLQQTRTITDHRLSKSTQNSETALCIVYIGNNKVAVGTKNGIIKLFCTKTGVKLNQLYGHTASICSLADVGNGEFIGSGGDIGCCQLMLWRVKGEELYHNFSSHHSAAITSILDLNDNKHFISGSFDCNLNIYNISKKQVIKSTSTSHKITFLSKCNSQDKTKTDQILSGNLNSQICVWKVNKNTFNTITGIVLLRCINIGTYPYSVVGWGGESGEEVLVVGKDDWVRVIDIGKGSVEKGTKIGQLTELISIEHQGENICLGCHKNGNIIVLHPANIQDENVQQKKGQIVGQGCPISYSCGITKKWAIASNPLTLLMPNHNNQSETEIKVWRIYPGGIKFPNKHIEVQQNFNNKIDDVITGHTY